MLIVHMRDRPQTSLSADSHRQIRLCAAPIPHLSTESSTESPQTPHVRGLISSQEVNVDAYFQR
jgi:hypothetical protein